MSTHFISFHNGNIPQAVLAAQQSVFEHYRLPLKQIKTDLQHPDAIDHWIKNNEWDTVVIFDIDCIPVNLPSLEFCIKYSANALVGAEQHASHIIGSIDYVSPAFVVLNKKLFEKMQCPSFAPTYRCDVGGELTHAAHDNNVQIMFLEVSDCIKPMWKLSRGEMFGIGTTYANTVFHAFESRMNASARNCFIDKCNEVILQP